MNPKSIALKPRTSEKTYALAIARNTYVFQVPLAVNKIEIKAAVEAQFGVTVIKVRIVIAKGKDARSIRIGSRVRSNASGFRSDVKKAYVTLKDGDSLPVFAALDEQVAASEKTEKATKATTDKKDDAKDAKKSGLGARLGRKKKEETK